MSDSFFHEPYDPLATPNPAYDDDDLDAAPQPRSAWDRRSLSQAMLARARARQEAIADAFIDALLEGKFSFFRLLMDLEQAAIAGEAEAQQARQPTLAEILLPMIERERREAANPEPQPAPATQQEPSPSRPMLVAPHQPGTADINAAAERPCRTHSRKRQPKTPSRNSVPPAQTPLSLRKIHACATEPNPYHRKAQITYCPPLARQRRRRIRHANNPIQESCTPPLL